MVTIKHFLTAILYEVIFNLTIFSILQYLSQLSIFYLHSFIYIFYLQQTTLIYRGKRRENNEEKHGVVAELKNNKSNFS